MYSCGKFLYSRHQGIQLPTVLTLNKRGKHSICEIPVFVYVIHVFHCHRAPSFIPYAAMSLHQIMIDLCCKQI